MTGMMAKMIVMMLRRKEKEEAFPGNFYRVFFFTGTPPKKLKYGKPRLGESTLT